MTFQTLYAMVPTPMGCSRHTLDFEQGAQNALSFTVTHFQELVYCPPRRVASADLGICRINHESASQR
jgi:hypothetical protein